MAFWTKTVRNFRAEQGKNRGWRRIHLPTHTNNHNLLEPSGNENEGFVVLFPAIWSSRRGFGSLISYLLFL